MCQYALLFGDQKCEPRTVEFEGDTPAQVLTVAQRKNCPAHLFKDGDYVCTLQHNGDYWIIANDVAAARKAAAAGVRANTLMPAVAAMETSVSVRRPQPAVVPPSVASRRTGSAMLAEATSTSRARSLVPA